MNTRRMSRAPEPVSAGTGNLPVAVAVPAWSTAASTWTASLDALAGGFTKYEIAEDLQQYLRDVADHTAQANERIAPS